MKNCRDDIVIDVDGDCIFRVVECIFRVPRVLRRQKPEAYTPDVVSIGPFHHPGKRGKRKGHFKLMERMKQRYLNEILSHMGNISLKDLTAIVTDELSEEGVGFENRARGFYAEPLDHISSDDFKEMMIVDGCFLIHLFRDFHDPDFNMNCMFHSLCHDILLLENQLPWFVLSTLYRLTHHKYPHGPSQLSVLILEAFTKLPSLKQCYTSYIKHLTNNPHKCRCSRCDDDAFLHVLDLMRASIVVPLQKSNSKPRPVHDASDAIFEPDQHQMRTATALSKVGIKFRNHIKDKKNEQDWEEGILGIRFYEVGSGVLIIPQLDVGMLSETLFRNMVAIEQCYHGYSYEITSYAILMDNLICSQEDMELLLEAKVIGNWLSDEDGCDFFNNLRKGIPHNNFHYKDLCVVVNKQYRSRQRRMIGEKTKEGFKYFYYVIVGVFLLQIVPTIVQTAYTIMQYYFS